MALNEVEILPEGEKVYQTWERVTGKPWQDAHKDGFSDGKYDTNIDLQKRLNEGWNPYTEQKKEVTNENDLASPEAPAGENTTTETPNSTESATPANASDEPRFKSYGDFISDLGFQEYSDETDQEILDKIKKRQAAMENRKKLSAIGEVAKLLVETGGSEAGSYTDKRERNPYLDQADARIQELKDKELLEMRRSEANRNADRARKEGMYASYRSQQDSFDQQDKTRKEQEDFTRERDKTNLDNSKELIQERAKYDKSNDKDFLKWKANLEVQKQKEISAARNEDEINSIEIRYNQMYEYQKKLLELGVKENKAGGYDIGGESYTKEGLDIAVADILASGVELPYSIKSKIQDGKKLDEFEKIYLIKMFGKKSSAQPGSNVPYQEGTEPIDPVSETQGGFWNDTQAEQETDIYGNPIK